MTVECDNRVSRLKRIKRKLILSLINSFLCGTSCFKIKQSLLRKAGIVIGDGTKIVGPFIVGNVSDIVIGSNNWIGTDFKVYGNGTLVIGDNCDFGPNVSILTGSHKIGCHNHRAGEGLDLTVRIGNGCWIGAKSTLLGNVNINDGAIVAAGAVVTSDVLPDTLVGGVPSKIIKELES